MNSHKHLPQKGSQNSSRPLRRTPSNPDAWESMVGDLLMLLNRAEGGARRKLRITFQHNGCERLDLNQRPLGYEPSELPNCSTPR